MSLMPDLSAFRVWPQRLPTFTPTADADAAQPFASTAVPSIAETRLAVAVVCVSALLFAGIAPFAHAKMGELWAFIPIYQSALVLTDLITAALLFAQYVIVRSRALLVLACAYLFSAGMVVSHTLSFPGLFSSSGLLGAGPQTTAWLYMFWHLGFPLAIIGYATLKGAKRSTEPDGWVQGNAILGIGVVSCIVVGLTALGTTGHSLLPNIMLGNSYSPAMVFVVSTVWLMSVLALFELWRRPPVTTIDLWLMVTMCAWIFDIALSAVLNAGRFDLGFYAGRMYGLLASTFVLVVLIAKTSSLYARLSRLLDAEQVERRRESTLRRRLFDTSLDLMFVVDRQGTLIEVSPSSKAILGYSPSEMIGRSAIQFIHGEDLEPTRSQMRKTSRGAPTSNFDCRYVHKEGRIVPLSWKGLWSQPDQQHYFIGRDMTQRLALEQQLRHAQKMEAVGQLTGGIAHDFNNILAVIIGMTELTGQAVASDAKLSAMVKQIDESAERGVQLVQRMLAFARKQPLEPRVLDVNDTVAQSVAILERTLGEHITVTAAPFQGLWPAIADPSQMADAIVNLCVNARDAMPKGGRIVIETANAHLDEAYVSQHAEVVSGDYVLINVTDSGAGIPADILDRVFEPFFTTKDVGRGTGLGLSMVYGFIKQSRGHVKIYSEVGHGTSVRLYFPRAGQRNAPRALPAAQREQQLPVGNETILVVEDDPAVRNMVVGALENLGYTVLATKDGKSGLALIRQNPNIDLLFTDMVMPDGMNGTDLIDAGRIFRPGLKALLTSGYSEQFIRTIDGMPNVRLLSKPYRKEKLATTIRQVLDEQLNVGVHAGSDDIRHFGAS